MDQPVKGRMSLLSDSSVGTSIIAPRYPFEQLQAIPPKKLATVPIVDLSPIGPSQSFWFSSFVLAFSFD
jgi:hypothetical protein